MQYNKFLKNRFCIGQLLADNQMTSLLLMINSQRHFGQDVMKDTEQPIPQHPRKTDCKGWVRNLTFPFILAPVTDDEKLPPEVDSSYFFCTRCCSWYSMNGTIGNLHVHISHRHHELVQNQKEMSTNERNRLFKYFLLTSGLPFQILDNPIIAQLFPGIGTRKDIATYCSKQADAIRAIIRSRIVHAHKISISIDEWKDQMSRRFLGIQAYNEYPDKYEIYTLGLMPIEAIHATAQVLAGITSKCLGNYGVEKDQVVAIVTDTANVMKATSDCLELRWSPCYCHIANLILQSFIKASGEAFKEIQEIQRTLGSNPMFRQFCKNRGSHIISIPSFTETRWYSAYSMVKAIFNLQPHILAFLNEEKKAAPPDRFWDMVRALMCVLHGFRTATLYLEHNCFGSRSFVVMSFRYLRDTVHQLDLHPEWNDAIQAFDSAMFLKWEANFNYYRMELLLALRLNPSLHGISLTNEEIEEVDGYIRSKVNVSHRRTAQRRPQTSYGMDFSTWQAMNTPGSQEDQDEFTLYLNIMASENTHFLQFDLWDFWKKNRTKMPTLYNLAMDVYSIPASSASVEREFSKAKRFQGEHRINLSGTRLEDQMIIAGNEGLTNELFNSRKI